MRILGIKKEEISSFKFYDCYSDSVDFCKNSEDLISFESATMSTMIEEADTTAPTTTPAGRDDVSAISVPPIISSLDTILRLAHFLILIAEFRI